MKVLESKKEKTDNQIESLIDFLRESEEAFTFKGGFPEASDNAAAILKDGYKTVHVPLLRKLAKTLGVSTMGKSGGEILQDIADTL